MLAVLLAGSASAPPVDLATACPADTSTKGLVSEASRSALVGLLRNALGAPTACKVDAQQGKASVAVSFPLGGRFVLSIDETLESSSVYAALPASAGLTRARAAEVLRTVERQMAPPSGCGIRWAPIERKRSTPAIEREAEGTSCNCKAGVRLDNDSVVALHMSMAC